MTQATQEGVTGLLVAWQEGDRQAFDDLIPPVYTETAEVLQISERTVHRDWTVAKAWLYRAMQGTAR